MWTGSLTALHIFPVPHGRRRNCLFWNTPNITPRFTFVRSHKGTRLPCIIVRNDEAFAIPAPTAGMLGTVRSRTGIGAGLGGWKATQMRGMYTIGYDSQ
jgi:hypothetical protein